MLFRSEQSKGIAEQSKNDLCHDKAAVEEHADGKGAAKIDFVVMRMAHRVITYILGQR